MSGSLLQGLDALAGEALEVFDTPGAAVTVVRDGEIVHCGGYGVRERGRDEAVDADTLFQVGSTTKAFTAAALGMLVDEGRIGWDDPVRRHWSAFELDDPQRTRESTVRDILAHRSGFIDTLAHGLEILTAEKALGRMRFQAEMAPFRRSYRYSNLMYGVAGKLIEEVTGNDWHGFIRDRILVPLGMTRSVTSPHAVWDERHLAPTIFGEASCAVVSSTDTKLSNVAMPHANRRGSFRTIPWQSYNSLAPAGSLVASITDMARWTLLHADGGAIDGRRLVNVETLAEMHSGQNDAYDGQFPFAPGDSSCGLGWRCHRYHGERLVFHTGLILGFPAQIMLLPARRFGITILANGQTASEATGAAGEDPFCFHKAIALSLIDALIDAPEKDWRGEFATRRSEAIAAVTEAEKTHAKASESSSAPAGNIEGTYHEESGRFGNFLIAANDSGLMLRFDGAGAFRASIEDCGGGLIRLHPSSSDYLRPFAKLDFDSFGNAHSLKVFGSEFRKLSTAPSCAMRADEARSS